MPTSMAGLRGGIELNQKKLGSVPFFRDLIIGRINDPSEIKKYLLRRAAPKTLTFTINNTCNLNCRHCYLKRPMLLAPSLSISEWHTLINSTLGCDIELFCLSGKEIFINDRGIDLLEYICELRQKSQGKFRVGAITNGTRLGRYAKKLESLDLDYLDISVDGTPILHNLLRGRNAFDLLKPNLQWAAKSFGDKLYINLTLHKRNWQHLKDTLLFLDKYGVENIGCGAYRPLSYTDNSLTMTKPEYDRFFSTLHELKHIKFTNPKIILFDLDITVMDYLLGFFRSNWFDLNNLSADLKDDLYIEHTISDCATLVFRLMPAPKLVHESARITSDGYYLASEDTVDTLFYSERSLGNVREAEINFGTLHERGLKSARIDQIIDSYIKNDLPRIQCSYDENQKQQAIV